MPALVLLAFQFAFFLGDHPVAAQIDFVPDYDLDGICALVLLEDGVPELDVGEGGRLGDIIDKDCAVSILHVAGNEAPEPLLPRGVPELNPVLLAGVRHVLDVEVDSHCGLDNQKCTLSPS